MFVLVGFLGGYENSSVIILHINVGVCGFCLYFTIKINGEAAVL